MTLRRAHAVALLALFALVLGTLSTAAARPEEIRRVAQASPAASTKKKKKPPKKTKKKPTPAASAAAPAQSIELDEPSSADSAAASPPSAPGASAPANADSVAAEGLQPATAPSAKSEGEAKESDSSSDEFVPAPINAELLLGFGIGGTNCGGQGCNPYGFGFGLRGGYTLRDRIFGPGRLYLGGTLGYHVGYSAAVRTAPNPYNTDYSGSVFYIGPEAGYEMPVGPILLRPMFGIGLAGLGASVKDEAGPQQGVERGAGGGVHFILWPGVTGTYFFTPMFFGALDLRIFLMPGGESSFAFFFSGGARFAGF